MTNFGGWAAAQEPGERPPGIAADAAIRTAAGSPATTSLVLTNNAAQPRYLTLSVRGADASWLPPDSRSAVLQPGESVGVELTFHPAAGTVPAVYPVALTVQAIDPVTDSATAPVAIAELNITVDAPGQIAVRIEPTEARAVFGKKVKLYVENTGITPASVDLSADAAQGMRVVLPARKVEVAPGQTVSLRATLRPSHRRFFGGRVRRTYSVTGRSKGAPRTAEGAFIARGLLGPGATLVTLIIALLALWVGAVIVFIPKLSDHVRNAHLARPAVTQTATASPSAGSSGGSGGAGGGSSGGSGGSGGGSGGGASASQAGQSQAAGGAGAAAANTVQFNGTVSGRSPGGVGVSVAPVSPVTAINSAQTRTTPAGEAVTPLGFSASAVTGKISSDALDAAHPSTAQNKSTTTSTDGAWTIPGVSKPGYYLVTFSKPGYQTIRFMVDSSAATAAQPMAVTLTSAEGKLDGTVNGPDGPVGGAQVVITDGVNTLTTSSASTGSDIGTWSVTGLSTPSSYLVTVSKNGLSTESTLIPLDAGAGQHVPLTLHAGVTSLRGTILGRDNSGNLAGLGGATVTATSGDGDNQLVRTATTVTQLNVAGNYIIPALPPGSYTVTVAAQGYVTQTAKITIVEGASQKVVNTTLSSASGSVLGTVTDVGGVGQIGAGIVLANASNTYKTTTTSSPAGGFSFDGVAPGTYTLTASIFGLTTGTESVTLGPGDLKSVSLSLSAAGSTVAATGHLKGQVVDAQKLSSLSNKIQLTASLTNPAYDPSAPATDKCASKKVFSTTVTADQQYQLPDPTTDTDCGLPPGLYDVTLTTTSTDPTVPAYEGATLHVAVALGVVTTAPTVSLNTRPVIAGTITAAIGTPSGPTCVWAVPDGSPVDTTALGCAAGTPPAASGCPAQSAWPSGTTCVSPLVSNAPTAVGAYTLVVPAHGAYRVYVRSADSDYNTASDNFAVAGLAFNLGIADTKPYDVQLHRFGHVAVTVRYPGGSGGALVPVPNGSVISVYDNAACTGTPVQSPTVSGVLGQLSIDHLQPAIYYLHAQYSTYESDCQAQIIGIDQDVSANLSLIKAIAAAVGRLFYKVGSTSYPLPNAQVILTGPGGYDANNQPVDVSWRVKTDANGCFGVQSASSADPTGVTLDDPACQSLITNWATEKDTNPIDTTYLPVAQFAGQKLLSNIVTISTADPNASATSLISGYQPISSAPLTLGALPHVNVAAQLTPTPVPFTSTLAQNSVVVNGVTVPAWTVSPSTFDLSITPTDGTVAPVTTTLTAGTGVLPTGVVGWGQIGTTQSGVPNALVAGTYTVSLSHTGYVADTATGGTTVTATMTCSPPIPPVTAGTCTTAPATLNLYELSHLTLTGLPTDLRLDSSGNPIPTRVELYDGSTLVATKLQALTPTVGTSVTFDNVLPTHAGYVLKIRAAGYKYTDDAAGDGLLDASCETAGNTLRQVDAGATESCQVNLIELGKITGTVNVQDMQISSYDPTPPTSAAYAPGGTAGWHSILGGATVTATLCDPGHPVTTDPSSGLTTCTAAQQSDHVGYLVTQSATANASTGQFVLAANSIAAGDTQGLPAGKWVVTAKPTNAAQQPYYCLLQPTDAAPTACPSATAVTGSLVTLTADAAGNVSSESTDDPANHHVLLFHTAASFSITAVDNYSYPADHVTIKLSDTAVDPTVTPPTVNGVAVAGVHKSGDPVGTYSFPALQPGTYYVYWSSGAFGWADGNTTLTVADGGSVGNITVQHYGYSVAGTVTANGSVDLNGATVCLKVGTTATPPSASSTCANTSDAVMSYPTATPSNSAAIVGSTNASGAYTFSNVPATPSGSAYYVRVEAYGYNAKVSPAGGFGVSGTTSTTSTQDIDFASTDAITRTVVITVSAPSTNNGTTNLLFNKVTSSTNGQLQPVSPSSGWSAPFSAVQSGITFTDADPTSTADNDTTTLTIGNVPFGCYTFGYNLKTAGIPNHFGSLAYSNGAATTDGTGTANGTSLKCPQNSILVSGGGGSSDATASTTLTEYEATATVNTCTTCYGLTAPTAVQVVASVGGTAYVTNTSFPVGTATSLGWYDPSAAVDVAVSAVSGTGPAWNMPTIAQITQSGPSHSGTLTVNRKTVTIHVNGQYTGSLNGATVALTAPSDASGYSGTLSVVTGSGSNANGDAAFTLPYSAVGWTGTITAGSGDFADGTVSSFTVSGSSTDPSAVSLTRNVASSVTVHVTQTYHPAGDDSLAGATVSLNPPSGWSGAASISCSDAGSGDYTCANVPYGSGWTFSASKTHYGSQSSSTFVVSSTDPTTTPTVDLTQAMVTATLSIDQDDSSTPLVGAMVSLAVPSDVANFSPTANYAGGGSPTAITSSGTVSFSLPYTSSSWAASVTYLGATMKLTSGAYSAAVSSTAASTPTIATDTKRVVFEATKASDGSAVNNATFAVTSTPSGANASWTGTLSPSPTATYTSGSNTGSDGLASFVLPYGVGWQITGTKGGTSTPATVTVDATHPSGTTTVNVA